MGVRRPRRKTLPTRTIPRWLDPYHVDVADPTELPQCWYGVPFVRKLVVPPYTRAYRSRELLHQRGSSRQAWGLDTFQTWANLEVWFQKQSGLKLDLNLVWGQAHSDPHVLFEPRASACHEGTVESSLRLAR
ncbi:hypothetical protein LXA43DRAFT_636995 [Ganoderma leucocontextum]|nr:hypothetical protein LXA43DRAFT_636995 [Ganoderma leucocontextum]